MNQILINLTSAASGTETSAAAGQVLSTSGSEDLFSTLLCRAINEGQKAGVSSTSGTGQAQAPVDLADLLSALLGNTANGLAERLQSMAASLGNTANGLAERLQSMAESSAGLAGATEQNGGETAEQGTGANGTLAAGLKSTGDTAAAKTTWGAKDASSASQDLQSLLIGLISLVMNGNGGTEDASAATPESAGQDEMAAADAAGSTQASAGPASGSAQASAGPASGGTSKEDSQSILQTLGLLLFAGLEAAAAMQGGATPATSQGTNPGTSEDGSGSKGGETKTSASSAQVVAAGLITGSATGTSGANTAAPIEDARAAAVSPEGAGVQASTSPSVSAPVERLAAQDGQTAAFRVELSSTPSTDGDTAKNGITLTIKAPLSIIGGAHESAGAQGAPGVQGASGVVTAAAQDGQNGNGSAVLTIVKELTPLTDAGSGTASGDDGTGREKSADKEQAYPLAPDGAASAANTSGQDQKTTGTTSASGSIERFDRVVEQLAGTTGSHELTVRITLDNQSSLVLGLKDLGQTVTVDVRSSDQALIGLLQSQKDAIVQHLDGQDIRAQIVIDPNASGTPEQKERQQDARQKSFTPRKQADSAFGAFLETFA
jgi:hypothetical protein